MNPIVVLHLGKGSCEKGLPDITAQLWLDDNQIPIQCVGSLPPAPELTALYSRWRKLYEALHNPLGWRISTTDAIEFESEAVTNVSRAEFRHWCKQLQLQINEWLNDSGFRKIDQTLRANLDRNESIRFIIETDDSLLQKLPWHLWQFFDHYNQAEMALSAQEYGQVPPVPNSRIGQRMRILVVLGDNEGIDVQQDRMLLEAVNAETVVLTEPERSELDIYLWDKQGWDILFFAGHSTSQAVDAAGGMTEQLFLNPNERLSIADLRHALKAAIGYGLKLAIFNSCDGLGLARELTDLNLPQLIVMREPIIDKVAHKFLKHFLQDFSDGEPFYTSVRHAREKLQGQETDFPGASWLPVIFQNPTERPFTWPAPTTQSLPLPETISPPIKPPTIAQKVDQLIVEPPVPKTVNVRSLILSTSLAIALLIMGGRLVGLLQPFELFAYDDLIRSRSIEWEQPIDQRLLVVEIDENDTNAYGYPITDERLATALEKLQQHQPKAIGIDLHRQQPNEPGREKLLDQFKKSPNVITVCAFGQENRTILSHPPEFSVQQANHQVGFSDLELDDALGPDVVRRQLLSYNRNVYDRDRNSPNPSECITPYSFSFNLALRFLRAEGVKPLIPNQDGDWQLGPVVFERLSRRTGGYQNLDGQSSQVLLNYRFNPTPAQKMSLTELLEGDIDDALVRNRVVLMGITDKLGNDFRSTPYGQLPGVWIHAHSVSQVLGAVLDNRALIWTLPQWIDILWVWGWAVIGGLLVWRLQSLFLLGIASVVAAVSLRQICLLILTQGGWLPFIPALLALVGTIGILLVRKHRSLQFKRRAFLNRFAKRRSLE